MARYIIVPAPGCYGLETSVVDAHHDLDAAAAARWELSSHYVVRDAAGGAETGDRFRQQDERFNHVVIARDGTRLV